MSSIPRSALIFQGPGFLEDGVLETLLQSLGFHVHIYQMLQAKTQVLDIKLGPEDIIFFRGSSSCAWEDLLYTRYLSHSLKGISEKINKLSPQQRPRLVVSGRWALGSLWANFIDSTDNKIEIVWKNLGEHFTKTQWIKATDLGANNFYVLKTSDTIAEFQGAGLKPILRLATGNNVGWKFNNVYMFSLDPFSLSDAVQLPGFGYDNYEDLLTGKNYLMSLIKGD